MPRGMFFGPEQATSIDLCVRDFVGGSRFSKSTTVFADSIARPFRDIDVELVPHSVRRTHALRIGWLWWRLRRSAPDVVVAHHHLPTAAWLARLLPGVPVLFHVHNFIKAKAGRAHRHRVRQFGRLAGVICVSDAVRGAFERDYPQTTRAVTVHNGLDVGAWEPATARDRTILLVARAAPVKGIREAVMALREVLPRHPGWRAVLILSEKHVEPAFSAEIEAMAGKDGSIAIRWQLPFSEIKNATEQAAIAMVPSVWEEPFGRTALEAHAGGAALISSGTGGLREVSDDAAVYLSEVTATQLAAELEALIVDPDLRQTLGAKGLSRARVFDLLEVSKRLDAVYESVKSSKART